MPQGKQTLFSCLAKVYLETPTGFPITTHAPSRHTLRGRERVGSEVAANLIGVAVRRHATRGSIVGFCDGGAKDGQGNNLVVDLG